MITEREIRTIQELSPEEQNVVMSLVNSFRNSREMKEEKPKGIENRLSMEPLEVLSNLREQGLKNPMEMDDINAFISESRSQRTE